MGTMANAKVAAISIAGDRVDPKLVETIMASTPEQSAPEAPADKAASDAAKPVVSIEPAPPCLLSRRIFFSRTGIHPATTLDS